MNDQAAADLSPNAPVYEREMTKIAELIAEIPFAMLTTVEESGELHARPMATTARPFDGTLVFFTEDESAKVGEVMRNRKVGVSFADPARERFISFTGLASVSQDHVLMAQAWTDRLKGWFPRGLQNPDLALIVIRVTDAEYWDTPPSAIANLWGAARATFGGPAYDPNTHGVLRFDAQSGLPVGR